MVPIVCPCLVVWSWFPHSTCPAIFLASYRPAPVGLARVLSAPEDSDSGHRPCFFCGGRDPEPSPSEHERQEKYLSVLGALQKAGCQGWARTRRLGVGSRQWLLSEEDLRGPCGDSQHPQASWVKPHAGLASRKLVTDAETEWVGDLVSSPPTKPSLTSSAAG